MYENRNYLIIPITELSKVDFSLVLETSAETVRKSVNETKTFIKWNQAPSNLEPYETIDPETGETTIITPGPSQPPAFVDDIVGAEGPYTHEEIMTILATEEWNPPAEEEEE